MTFEGKDKVCRNNICIERDAALQTIEMAIQLLRDRNMISSGTDPPNLSSDLLTASAILLSTICCLLELDEKEQKDLVADIITASTIEFEEE